VKAPWRHSIRGKLSAIAIVTCAFGIGLAFAASLINSVIDQRAELAQTLQNYGRLIESNSNAALTFNDRASAAEALMVLRARPAVVSGRIYSADGVPFATYRQTANETPPARAPEVSGAVWRQGRVELCIPITGEGLRLGSLYLAADQRDVLRGVRHDLLFFALLFPLCLAAALLFASRLQRQISEPIGGLARVANYVTEHHDYSARGKAQAAGRMDGGEQPIQEIQQLADAFNNMLERVGSEMDAHARAEREAHEARAFLDSTIDHIPDAITVKRMSDSRYVLANRTALEILGGSVVGRTDQELFGAEHSAVLRDEDDAVMTSRRTLACDDPAPQIFAGERTFSRTKVPLLDESGGVTYVVSIAEDITEKLRESQLVLQRETADAANLAKSAFLARMSHEIRTPMNGVLGMATLLAETTLDSEQREYAETIQTSATALLDVINDILDISRIEADKMSLAAEAFSPRMVLSESARVIAVGAAARSIELVVDVDPSVPRSVIGDAGRIRQMVLNLAGNALKFTERGEIVISAKLVELRDQRAVIEVSVRDSGPGIAPEAAARLFSPFEQVDSSASRRHAGSGLGLAITRRLAEQMGGRAWLESRPGEGSTFFFTIALPLETAAIVLRKELDAKEVVLIEPSVSTRNAVARILTTHGASVRSYGSWQDAEPHLWAPVRPVDFLIATITSEESGGPREVSRAFSHGLTGEQITLLLQPSQLHSVVEELGPSGVRRFVLKPVAEERLLEVLITSPTIESAEQENVVTPRSMHILVAEDNLINQRVIAKFLARDRHDVVIVSDGLQALAEFQRQSFDVILMDVQMPEMDGLAATAAMRALERHVGVHTPIIALTAHSVEGDRERCLAAGMDGYVSKPIRYADLQRALNTAARPHA
jgi:signal transduction histidine kinase/CheY-like chemotaxis protein